MALTERLEVLITAAGGGAISEFKKVGQAAKDAHDKIAKAQSDSTGSASRLDSVLQKVGISSSTALGVGVVAAAGAAGLALGKFAVDGVRAFATYGAEVAKVRRVTGSTSEDASRLVAVFHALGIDTDQAATALFRMGKNIGEGGAKLREFGIEIAKNRDGSTNLTATLLNVGDAYKRTTDPAQRSALAFAVFGKQAQTLAPILGRSRQELEAFGQAAAKRGLIFSDQDVQKAIQFQVASRELHESISGLQIELGKELLPVLAEMVHELTSVVDKINSLSKHAGGLSKVIGALSTEYAPGASRALSKMSTEAAHSADANSQAEQAALGAGAAFDEEAGGAQAARKAVSDHVNAVLSYAHAQLGVEQANRAVREAQQRLSDAETGGAERAQRIADAARDVQHAHEGVTSALRDVADAQRALDAAQRGPDPRDLASAQLDVKDAQLELADSQKALVDVNVDGKATAEDYERAQLRVERATISLSRAQDEAGQIQQDADNKVAGAQRALQDAQKRAAEAADTLAVAQQKQRDALKPVDVQAVADAQLDLRDAQLGVLGATQQSNDAYATFFDILSAGSGTLADIQGTLSALASLGFTIPGGLTGVRLPEQDVVTGNANTGIVRRRASGGSINGLALVGERGPELFAGRGTIIPNHQLGGLNIGSLNVYAPTGNADNIVDAIHTALLRKQRRSGALGLN